MPTRVKIKIDDDSGLRASLDDLYENCSQHVLAAWSIMLAKRILTLAGIDHTCNRIIMDAFFVIQSWQNGKARMHDVRLAGFGVHQLAKACSDVAQKAALRTAGQAIATGHMKEHAMVASDYAIKTINLLHPNDKQAVTQERLQQIEELTQLSS